MQSRGWLRSSKKSKSPRRLGRERWPGRAIPTACQLALELYYCVLSLCGSSSSNLILRKPRVDGLQWQLKPALVVLALRGCVRYAQTRTLHAFSIDTALCCSLHQQGIMLGPGVAIVSP